MRPVPFFFDTFPRSRRPDYSRQRGEIRTRVAIVGGGLTGCACASSFAAAGIQVVLLEADRIGAGATAASAGLLRQDLDASFQESAELHGLRTARHVWQGFRRASLDFSAALRRLGIRADLAPQDMIVLSRARSAPRRPAATPARVPGAARRRTSRRRGSSQRPCAAEAAIPGRRRDPHERGSARSVPRVPRPRGRAPRRRAPRSTSGRRCGASAPGARRSRSRPTAAAITRRRRRDRDAADCPTICARCGVTSRRRSRTRSSPRACRPPCAGDGQADRGAARHGRPAARAALAEGRSRALLGRGPDAPVRARLREKTVGQRANQLMYELTTLYPAISGLQPEWGWDFVHYGSPDGLPVVGPHRNFPRHLFALGQAATGPGSPGWRPGYSCGSSRASPPRGTSSSVSRGFCNRETLFT